MSLTLFGIIWIIAIIICFVNRRIKYLIALTLFSMILQCDNVLMLGDKGIGPQIVTSIFLILRSLIISKTHNKISDYSIMFLFCILFISYLFFNIYIHEIFSETFMSVMQIFIYILCAYRLYIIRNSLSVMDFKFISYGIIIFIVLFSPIQYLCTLGFIPRDILAPFFFNDTGEFIYFHHPEIYRRLLATFMEPSYCSTFIVGAFYFVFLLREKLSYSNIILMSLFVELILTTSSTGYGTFALMFVLYSIFFLNKNMIKLIIPIAVLLTIFYFMTKDTLLKDVIFNKADSESGVHRNSINERAMLNFSLESLYGVGYQQSRASSFAICMLAELGLVGTIIYLLFVLSLIFPVIFHKKYFSNHFEIASRLFIFSIIIAQIVAIPDIQLSTFWFALYLIALSKDKQDINIQL